MSDNGSEGIKAVVRESELRLRDKPSLDESKVLAVMPPGAKVVLSGDFANGFAGLTYNEMEGFAFLTDLEKESDQTPVGPIARVNKYAAGAPLREEPGYSEGYLALIPGGALVALLGDEKEGFVPVAYDGMAGYAPARGLSTGLEFFIYATAKNPWALQDDAAQPVEAVVRESGLNLRNKPSLDDSEVLEVMPAGTKVVLHGDFNDGFASVTLGVVEGWAFLTYLEMDSDQSPVGPIARVVESDERVVPLYGMPDESSTPLAEMPGGALVALLGEEIGGFVPVAYDGIVGYARTRSPENGDECFIYGTPENLWALPDDPGVVETSGSRPSQTSAASRG